MMKVQKRLQPSQINHREASGLSTQDSGRSGAALIVALWVLIILSLLVSGLAYDAHIESGVTSYYRKRMKSQYLAHAGIEWAKYLLARSAELGGAFEEVDLEDMEEEMRDVLEPLSRGVNISITHKLGDGQFTLQLIPEEGRRNVNALTDEDWEEVLDQGEIPEEKWAEFIDCFADWVDENDEHQLNGAESDHSFYKERGYECKNAPLDTVDELALIKNFSREVVFGGTDPDDDQVVYPGIAQWLTVWGDGKVNINTASREVLLTLPGVDDFIVDDILIGRLGDDGEQGTRDDGFESVEEMLSAIGGGADLGEFTSRITTSGKTYLRAVSIGEVHGIRRGVWCVLQTEGEDVIPVFWREEQLQ